MAAERIAAEMKEAAAREIRALPEQFRVTRKATTLRRQNISPRSQGFNPAAGEEFGIKPSLYAYPPHPVHPKRVDLGWMPRLKCRRPGLLYEILNPLAVRY